MSGMSGESGQEAQDHSLGDLRTMQGPGKLPPVDPDAGDRSLGDARTLPGAPHPAAGDMTPDLSLGQVKTMAGSGSTAAPGGPSRRNTPLSDRYELLEEIGRGGFARVWTARDRKLDRVVAVKRLLEGKLDGPMGRQTLERFEREATAIAQLNHRNIVMVYDHDADAEGHYIVMEHVGGGTLRDYIKSRGGRLPTAEAVELVKGIAQGLGYAHRKNLVHRDIKPANVLLQQDGDELTPKIVDFGLARLGSESELSLSGYGMGTPWYMPPEQRRNAKGVNHTADIYALGKVLYELVSGETPDNVDPEKIAEPWLTPVILKCIKSNPEERYFSCEELAKALSGEAISTATLTAGQGGEGLCPNCGARNAEDVKYCGKCGAGMARPCPECDQENSIYRKFCAGCGTDVEAFLGLNDIVGRIEQYFVAKKFTRVVKESGQTATLKFEPRGKKGQALVERETELRQSAESAEKHKAELLSLIESKWRDGRQVSEVQAAITAYEKLAVSLSSELVTIRDRLPSRQKLAAFQDQISKAEQDLKVGRWPDVIKALNTLHAGAEFKHHEDVDAQVVIRQRVIALREKAEALKQAEIQCHRAQLEQAMEAKDWKAVQTSGQHLLSLVPEDPLAVKLLARAKIEPHRVELVDHAWNAFRANRFADCARFCRSAMELAGEDFRVETDGYEGQCSELADLALQRGSERMARIIRRKRRIIWSGVAAALALALSIWAGWVIRQVNQKRSLQRAWMTGDWASAVSLANRLEPNYEPAIQFLNAWWRRESVLAQGTSAAVNAVARFDERLKTNDVDGALGFISGFSMFVDNILNMAFVEVKAGSFQMGTPSGGNNDERPVRTVRITRDFWMGKYEVTQREYQQLTGNNPSNFKGDDLPVERVSWNDAVKFCEELTLRERAAGRLPAGLVYRLPTEAEWEYAARGGANGRNTQYAGSDNPDTVAWHSGNSQRRTQRVGTKAANELGLHDMSGNVWEWVHDWYQNSYSGLSITDPSGPRTGSYRVRRGGSWINAASRCRVAFRGINTPTFTYINLGFRVVVAAPVQ